MFRTTLRSIAAHKLRLAATSLAIIVGVAFVTGTLILSDTLNATFDELFGQTTAGIDIAVQGPEDTTDPLTGLRDPLPVEVADEIAAVDGVSAVSPEVSGFAQLIGDDGEPIGGFGPPTLAFNVPLSPELDTATIRDGAYPTGPDEIAIDAGTAATNDFAVGDTVGLVVEGPVQQYTITGTFGFGELDSLAGATAVVFDPDTAFSLYGDGGYHTVYAAAEGGVDPDDLADDIAAALGDGVDVLTGEELADDQASDISEGLGFFTTGLLVFAGVSLFVGAFLIANTFSIILAQRTRELALLRAVGASRRQILGSVLGEALATGLVGSVLGFGLGAALAVGLFALLDAFGIALPQGDLVIAPATFVVAILLGTVLTAVVAVVPAARATRIPPVAALQAVAAPPPKRYSVLRYAAGGVVFALGVAGLALTLTQGTGILAVGVAAVITLLGAASLAPLVTKPLLGILGVPLSARGIQGQLATENARRNPRRTAATASALMIGLALVAFMAILAESFTRSATASIEESFAGDFQVNPAGFFTGQGGPGPQLEEDVAAVAGVQTVAVQQFGQVEIDGEDTFVAGFDPEEIDEVLTLDVLEGGADGLLATGLAVSDDVADREDVAVGDTIEIIVDGEAVALELGAVYETSPVASGWVVDASQVPGLAFGAMMVELDDDADATAVRPEVEAVLEAYPTLELRDVTEVQELITGQINQLLGVVSALLALSVIVALFGIVNTLGLSVFERTRELGLLRAVGATRSQVRSMIRWESVLIALLGAIFGLVLGVLFAWLVVTALADEAPLDLAFPLGWLVTGLIASAIAGVLAAILPARRASRVDVLRAIEAT
ncbi:ABC transporter permease [Euzebya sp.]|uniref:ABC transporter permease n=1 Tax=Euzebya sp. TaxID=1971409 RepID=UPI003518AC43